MVTLPSEEEGLSEQGSSWTTPGTEGETWSVTFTQNALWKLGSISSLEGPSE